MYCPRCGQQQVSDETRFCSRCGLPVGELAGWLAGGGALAPRREEAPKALALPRLKGIRRKGIRRGAKLMFLSGVLLPLFFGFGILMDHPLPLIVPLTIFFTGLSWLLYTLIFGEETPPAESQQARPSSLGTMSGNAALPPASAVPASGLGGQPLRTAELVKPPSVTEHTTKLLDND